MGGNGWPWQAMAWPWFVVAGLKHQGLDACVLKEPRGATVTAE